MWQKFAPLGGSPFPPKPLDPYNPKIENGNYNAYREMQQRQVGTDSNKVTPDFCARSPQLVVLTVGDGDLSCSLAILRAYDAYIKTIVVTTLLSSEEELTATYPRSEEILKELRLQPLKSTVLFGVDATRLHFNETILSLGPFDYILFHHPHLGYSNELNASTTSAQRHSSLLAHYLFSARKLLRKRDVERPCLSSTPNKDKPPPTHSPSVHLCLCSGQSKSWRLKSILKRLGLQEAKAPQFATEPLWPHLQASDAASTYSAETKRVPSYWLSQYGYQHQATHPHATQLTTVLNSHHHFLEPKDTDSSTTSPSTDNAAIGFGCAICQQRFENQSELEEHLLAPALPIKPTEVKTVELEDNRWRRKNAQRIEGVP